MKKLIFAILLLMFLFSCKQENRQLDMALQMAGDNRHELEKVIAHYSDNPQKLEAAEWLIANMPGHIVMWSPGIQAFADSVMNRELSQERADELWDSLRPVYSREIRQRDIETLNADFLTDNIDRAFEVWENSPWRDEIDFERFKKYVLPYRVDNELLRIGWRDSLISVYGPIVKDCRTAVEAYERIRRTVNSMRKNVLYKFPYIMDAVALRNHYSGVCIERCVYLANVCRALGLPVVIDNCGKWANYSDNSHTWVALVLDDGTYTVVDDDTIAKKHNIIDASTFKLNQPMPDGYPYTPEFRKRLVKVWRQTFHLNPVEIAPEFMGDMSARLSSPRRVDVSAEYGISKSVSVTPSVKTDDVWLCTHALTSGWVPQAHANVRHGAARFENISDSVVMLPMGLEDGKEIPVGVPFYLNEGRKVEINPDTTRLISATFTRKYPINSKWLTRFNQIPMSQIEGANSPDFANAHTLYTIRDVPVFHNTAEIPSKASCRYLRVVLPLPIEPNMERLDVYDETGKLVKSGKIRDKDYLDLGKPTHISRIDYFPWNDGNFVVPGHEYELAYWNQDHWQSIVRQVSQGYELTFDNIPSGALLLLHDLTEGKEERPFTLQDNRQIWW